MRRGLTILLLAVPLAVVLLSARMVSSAESPVRASFAREQMAATGAPAVVAPPADGAKLIMVGAALMALAAAVRRIA